MPRRVHRATGSPEPASPPAERAVARHDRGRVREQLQVDDLVVALEAEAGTSPNARRGSSMSSPTNTTGVSGDARAEGGILVERDGERPAALDVIRSSHVAADVGVQGRRTGLGSGRRAGGGARTPHARAARPLRSTARTGRSRRSGRRRRASRAHRRGSSRLDLEGRRGRETLREVEADGARRPGARAIASTDWNAGRRSSSFIAKSVRRRVEAARPNANWNM